MKEKIISIKATTFENGSKDGFEVTTSEQVILMGIENGQSCCESWGEFLTEDNTDEFIGAELLEINITDQLLNNEKFEHKYSGNVMFVTLKTSSGVIQFVAYNDHNGYYSHEATVISKQINHSEYL